MSLITSVYVSQCVTLAWCFQTRTAPRYAGQATCCEKLGLFEVCVVNFSMPAGACVIDILKLI